MSLPSEIQATLDAMEPDFRSRFLAEIEEITSPAMLYALADAMMKGQAFQAMIIATTDPRLYAGYDAHMRAAFVAGKRG